MNRSLSKVFGPTTTLPLIKLQVESLHPNLQALRIDQHDLAALAELGQKHDPALLAIIPGRHARREGGLVADEVDVGSEREDEGVSVREGVAPCEGSKAEPRWEGE